MDTSEFQDVYEYKEENAFVNNGIIYYSTGQVASMLGLSDSKVRYYTEVFGDVLNITISNKQRKFTHEDVERLKFILQLKSEGMSLKQIKNYCDDIRANGESVEIEKHNPMAIEVLSSALLKENKEYLKEFENSFFKRLESYMKQERVDNLIEINDNLVQHNKLIKQFVQKSNDVILEKIEITNENILDVKSAIDQREQDYKQRDTELIDKLKTSLEDSQRLFQEQQSKKSLWSRIFKK